MLVKVSSVREGGAEAGLDGRGFDSHEFGATGVVDQLAAYFFDVF
jgi:hypothetical protein